MKIDYSDEEICVLDDLRARLVGAGFGITIQENGRITLRFGGHCEVSLDLRDIQSGETRKQECFLCGFPADLLPAKVTVRHANGHAPTEFQAVTCGDCRCPK